MRINNKLQINKYKKDSLNTWTFAFSLLISSKSCCILVWIVSSLFHDEQLLLPIWMKIMSKDGVISWYFAKKILYVVPWIKLGQYVTPSQVIIKIFSLAISNYYGSLVVICVHQMNMMSSRKSLPFYMILVQCLFCKGSDLNRFKVNLN